MSAKPGDTSTALVWPSLSSINPEEAPSEPVPRHEFASLVPDTHLDSQLRTALDNGRAEGHSEGYSEGYAKGLAEGREAGQSEVTKANEARAAELFKLVQSVEACVRQCDAELARELVSLVGDAVELIVHEELSSKPELIGSVVEAGLETFVESRGVITLNLNPEDAVLIGEVHSEKAPVQICPDPSIARGGCYFSNGETELDMTLEHARREMRRVLSGGAGIAVEQAD